MKRRKKKAKAPKPVTRIRLTDGKVALDNSGRPTKLTPQVQAGICAALQSGIDFEMAARYAGVHDGSAANWKMWGKQGKSPITVAFYEAVSLAESQAAVGYAGTIAAASRRGVWQAGAWLLERKYPRIFGQKVQVEVAHELESFVTALADRLSAFPGAMDVVYELVESRIGPASATVGERLLAAGPDSPAAG